MARRTRSVLRWLAGTVCLSAMLACGEDDRPSVLLVTVDTLRADYLKTWGFGAETSPNLDALAREGVVFERALAASSATAPSHATIMTGHWVNGHTVGFNNGGTRLAEDEVTLASRFRDAGWSTAAFVSNFMLDRRVGLYVGFDVYDAAFTSAEANRADIPERSGEETTQQARAWLETEREGPFFLWVHYNDPHGPYVPPPPHDALQLPADPLAVADDALPVLEGQLGLRGIPAYQQLGDVRSAREYRRRYAGEIQSFDAWLGQLLAAVERAAAPRPLIVLLTADHGESMGEEEIYFSHGHGTSPDLAHVPFVLRAPGVPAGRRSEPVHHVDVLPTLLELAGLPVPGEGSGIALGTRVRAETPLPRRTFFVDVGFQVSAYRGDAVLRAHVGRPIGAVRQRGWDGLRWLEGGAFEAAPPPEALRAELKAYLAARTPALRTTGLDPEQEALLRALGYLPPLRR